jgi:phenylpropionate dioxygenase-like ring-hydroxylating dioxygenase large terminal subunit
MFFEVGTTQKTLRCTTTPPFKETQTVFKNFWYAIEFSQAITQQPKLITLMGRKFALYRNSSGQVVALDNRCAHRGAALSGGWVEEDCLRCPYHGWKYEANGTCIQIPANSTETPIPKRARVESYPVQEKHGFVWLFLGELPEGDRPPIPSYPQFDDPGFRGVQGEHHWSQGAHLTRIIENTTDAYHALFVHRRSIGVNDDPTFAKYNFEMADWSVSATMDIKIRNLRGLAKVLSMQDDPNPQKTYTFCLPNVSYLGMNFGKFRLDTFMAHVPIDHQTTLTKWMTVRNFLTHPLIAPVMDWNTRKVGIRLLEEDDVVAKTQPAPTQSCDYGNEILTAADTSIIGYRKLFQKYIDKNWVLETGY